MSENLKTQSILIFMKNALFVKTNYIQRQTSINKFILCGMDKLVEVVTVCN